MTRFVSFLLRALKRMSARLPSGLEGVANDTRHRLVRHTLHRLVSPQAVPRAHCTAPATGKPIAWLLWLQGEDNAPEIVRLCIDSARRHLRSFEVRVLDESNFRDFVSLPPRIEELAKTGAMSLTHLSDIIRFALLRDHGGLWVDATLFFLREPSFLERYPEVVTRRSTPVSHPENVANGRWTIYVLGGSADLPLWGSVLDMLLDYWRSHDFVLDYHLTDYILDAQFAEDARFQQVMLIDPSNPFIHEFKSRWQLPPEPGDLEMMSQTGNEVFKLSWKVNGDPTPDSLLRHLEQESRKPSNDN